MGEDATVTTVLKARDLTRPQAQLATASYRPGGIIVCRKAERGRPRAGNGRDVEAVDTGAVRLWPDKRPWQRTESKSVDWQPALWDANVA